MFVHATKNKALCQWLFIRLLQSSHSLRNCDYDLMERDPKFQFLSPLVFGIFSIVGGIANTLGVIDAAFGISRALPSLKFECFCNNHKIWYFLNKTLTSRTKEIGTLF